MITFQIFDEGRLVRTEQFSSKPSATAIKIGRVSSAHLRFEEDAQVARMHAVVECTREGCIIIDLGSPLGTLVNGKRVTKAALKSGDVVEVGSQRITVVLDDREGREGAA